MCTGRSGQFLPAERVSAFSIMSGCWLDAWFHHRLNAARLMLAESPNALNSYAVTPPLPGPKSMPMLTENLLCLACWFS